MSHTGIEHLALLRTDEEDLEEAIDRLSRRPPGRSGRRGREVYLQYEFGQDQGPSVFAEIFGEVVGLTWSDQDEETGVDILYAEDVPEQMERVRGRLRRPRTLARAIARRTGEEWTAELVRERLKQYRKDADPSSTEGAGERLLQAAAQLRWQLEQAARRRQALVSTSG